VHLAWNAFRERDLRSSLAQIRAARKLSSTVAVAQQIGQLLARVARQPR